MKTARSVEKIALGLVFGLLIFQLGTISVAAQASAANAEPPAPKPSAAVEKFLTEASRLAESKQPADSLKTAEQALDVARHANDKPGEAFAQQARGRGLEDLQRKDEAFSAWQEAARLWGEEGDAPEQVTALVQAGLLLPREKKNNAEKLFAQAVSVGKSDSHRPLAMAQCLYDSGVALSGVPYTKWLTHMNVESTQRQAAWDCLSAALETRERQTADSLQLAETLDALADVADQFGEEEQGKVGGDSSKYYSKEKEYSARALMIAQRLAPDSVLMVGILHKLAYSESRLPNDGTNFHESYRAALQLQQKLAPNGSYQEASMLFELGLFEDRRVDYTSALKYLTDAINIAERLAPETPEFAHMLGQFGMVNGELGDFRASRTQLERALGIIERQHRFLGAIYNNLGAVTLYESDFAAARDYFEKALSIFNGNPSATGGTVAALENLSLTYHQLGDLTSALDYQRRTLAVLEKDERASRMRAIALNGMADLLLEQHDFAEAANYYQRALDIRQKLAPDSNEVSETLSGFAKLARAQGNLGSAMDYDRRAIEIGEKSCPNLWCVAETINDFGELAFAQGNLDTSDKYLRRALEVRERILGPTHPDLARSLNDYAITLVAEGNTNDALADALRAEKIGTDHLRVSIQTLSERQALAYEATRASGLDVALTLASDPSRTASTLNQVLDAVIHSRALVFDELAARHRSAYGGGDPEVKQLADHLFSARARLASLVFRGVADTQPEVYRKLLDDAQQSKENAERALAEKSVAFRQDQAREQIGFKQVAASLPSDAALVAFVRYARHQVQTSQPGTPVPAPVPSYAAFVLPAGEHEPHSVPLGKAAEIDNLVSAWRHDIAGQAELPDLGANKDRSRVSGAALRRKIWDPLVPLFGGAREIFVVPDGALHLVNLSALPAGHGRYLIETAPLIHYLSAERDLVPAAPSKHGEGILVVGNPAFEQAGKIVVASSQHPGSTATPFTRGSRSACGSFQSLHFPPLPASQQEVEQIASLWNKATLQERSGITRGAEVLPTRGELVESTGADASLEAFLLEAPGKQVLHIATHGFFLEGNCESATQRRLDTDKENETFLPATAENPLLLSGLAFAGANRRASAKPDEGDGILTAEEIAGINLEGVDWAVLSACDTGVGEIKVGEGVLGLRRAFQVAGAKTVIMSLWPVEDEYSREWMRRLYSEHFLEGKDTVDSVRAASLGLLKARRKKQQSTNPFYWGAFIAAGDWK